MWPQLTVRRHLLQATQDKTQNRAHGSVMAMSYSTKPIRAGRLGLIGLSLAFGLSACVGGTTYGTGVSQEKQTLNDVYNMFTLKTKRSDIDYTARPDLVVPENTAALPEPLENAATTSNPEWPETPGERIARIREQASEADPRTGQVPVEERTRRKEGIRIETRDVEQENRDAGLDRRGNPIVGFEQKRKEQRKDFLARKSTIEVSSTPARRYLTDPPVEYRMPAETAPTGDEAYLEEVLAERKKKELEEKKRRRHEMSKHF